MKAAHPSWRLGTLLRGYRRAKDDLKNDVKDHGAIVETGKENGNGRPKGRERSKPQPQCERYWRFTKDVAVSLGSLYAVWDAMIDPGSDIQ